MAKESMKAREVKRAKLVAKYAAKRPPSRQQVTTRLSSRFPRMLLQCVCTTVAASQAVPRVICASSEFHAFSSVKWHRLVLSPELRKQAGNAYTHPLREY